MHVNADVGKTYSSLCTLTLTLAYLTDCITEFYRKNVQENNKFAMIAMILAEVSTSK